MMDIPAIAVMGAAIKTLITKGASREDAMLEVVQRAAEIMGVDLFSETTESRATALRLMPSLALAWAECAFPSVEPSHKLAASLMCTSMSKETAARVVPPWRCFLIRVPDGLLPRGDSFFDPPYALLVLRHIEQRFFMSAEISHNGVVFNMQPQLADFAQVKIDQERTMKVLEERGYPALPPEEKSVHERRALLLGRLIIGVCIEMEGKTSSAPPSARKTKRASPVPTQWVFKLGRPVTVDVRAAVRSFANGETGTSPTVQTLVAGHHKNQPHGPGGSLRKWIHIEPYWRGPEDAPILVRPHVMGE